MANINATPAQAKNAAKTSLGIVVSWDFGRGKQADAVSIRRSDVNAMLQSKGFGGEWFEVQSIDVDEALQRARKVGWASRLGLSTRYPVVKLDAEEGVVASYGVMRNDVTTEDATAQVGARVRVNPHTGDFEVIAPVDGAMDADCKKVANAVADFASELTEQAFNRDISRTLLRVVRDAGCISMRMNGGGTYFIPAGPGADKVLEVMDGMEALTEAMPRDNQFYGHVSVLEAGDARNVKTWHRNSVIAFEDEISELTEKLTKMQSKDTVRDGTWDARRDECSALMVKANQFATVLGSKLGDIQSALKALEAEFGSAQDHARAAALSAGDAFARIAKRKAAKAAKTDEEAPAEKKAKRSKKDELADALKALKKL